MDESPPHMSRNVRLRDGGKWTLLGGGLFGVLGGGLWLSAALKSQALAGQTMGQMMSLWGPDIIRQMESNRNLGYGGVAITASGAALSIIGLSLIVASRYRQERARSIETP